MNPNEEPETPTTTQPETTPAAAAEMPSVEAGAVMGQEAIEEQFAAEQEAELSAIRAEMDSTAAQTPETPDDRATDETPDEAKPQAATPPPAEKPAEGTPTEDAIANARLDAERAAAGRYGGRLQQMEKELAQAREQLAKLQNAPATSAQPPEDPDTDPEDADLERLFGKDWADQWGRDGAVAEYKRLRRAAQIFGGGTSVKDTVKAEVGAVLDSERRAGNLDRLWQELEAAVPGAKKANAEAATNGFGAFLDGFQAGTVTKRSDIANQALDLIEAGAEGAEREAAKKVLEGMFTEFLGAKTAPAKDTNGPTGRTVVAKPIDPKKYVAPTTAGAGAPSTGRKTYTREAVEAFLAKAEAKGEAAYQAAFKWVCEQENLGTITD